MTEESELLRKYAEEGSEAAFAELVRSRVDLVFSVALRQVGGEAALAEDVTQKVFTDLARKSRALCRHPVLGGWLYRAARFAATDAVRAEQRRRNREQEAAKMNEILARPDHGDEWAHLRPALDRTISQLGSADRDILVLRFFESRTFSDIGRILSVREDAARRRVDRALGRLRNRWERLGATSSASALAAVLARQVSAAPSHLASKVALSATAGSALTGAASGGLFFFHLMSTTKITLSVVSAVALLGIGAALFEHQRSRTAEQALTESRRQNDVLQARLRRSERALLAANTDANALLQVTDKLRQTAPDQLAPFVRSADIQARLHNARELAKAGNWDGALKEYLWLFDVGMKRSTGFFAVRLTMLTEMAKMGQSYPQVLEALRVRRDQMTSQVQAGDDDFTDIAEFMALNKALGDDSRNLTYYDQLPSGDRQRRSMGTSLYPQFVADQRYTEAAQARPYSSMLGLFRARTQDAASFNGAAGQSAATSRSMKTFLIKDTASDVEVLAAVGKIAEAQQLAASLLAYDGSDETRTALLVHVTRAGHPELLTTLPNP